MDNREIIQKIEEMESVEDKKVLKELLQKVLMGVMEYQKEQNENLRKSLEEEIPFEQNNWPIYSLAADRTEYHAQKCWLQPVLEQEEQELQTDWDMVKMCVMAHQKVVIDKIFLKADTGKIQEITEKEQQFPALLVTDKRKIAAKIILRKYTGYLEKIEELQQTFRKNKIPWNPLNMAYFHKFAEIVLTKCYGVLQKEEQLQGIEIDYGEMEPYILKNRILLWNLIPDTCKSTGFPIPQDKQMQYKFIIRQEPSKGRFLLKLNQNDEYLIRKRKQIEVISRESGIHEWHIYDMGIREVLTWEPDMPLLDNRNTENFANRYAENFTPVIYTRAEMERKIQSLHMERYVQLEEISIKDLADRAFSKKPKQTIILSFRSMGEEQWLEGDIISYIVAVMEQHFLEYEFRGELL